MVTRTCNSFSVVRSFFRLSEALKVFRLETKSEIAKKKRIIISSTFDNFFLGAINYKVLYNRKIITVVLTYILTLLLNMVCRELYLFQIVVLNISINAQN